MILPNIMYVFWALWNFNEDSSCYVRVNVNTEIFTDMYGESSMSDGLVEVLPSASGEILW
jgi:hypothetical protein